MSSKKKRNVRNPANGKPLVQTRITYLDTMKGIGILTVIFGHLFKYGDTVSKVIFSFHMPLFFFVSGMFFRSDKATEFKPFLVKKCKQLLIPYLGFLLFGLIVSLIVPSWRMQFSKETVLSELYLAAPEHFHVGQIWFLMCLFFVEIYFYFINKFILKKNSSILIITSLLALTFLGGGYAMRIINPHMPHGRMPLKIDTALMATLFYAIGYLAKESINDKDFIKTNILLLPICAAVTLFLAQTNGWVNMAMTQYFDVCSFVFFAISGIVLVAFIARFTDNKLLQYIGRNSLVIFSLHSFGLYIYTYILSKIYNTQISNGVNVSNRDAIIGGILISAAMIPVAYLYNKLKAMITNGVQRIKNNEGK